MKKIDNIIYNIIKILGIIVIAITSYIIIFQIMVLVDNIEFLEVLTDSAIYLTIYSTISKIIFPLILIVAIIAIPYLVIFAISIIALLIKYIKFKGEKKKQIITILILGILVIFLITKGIITFPLTRNYEIKVNSKIDAISNTEVRNFLKSEIDGNKYVYEIKIRQGFPDDFSGKIYYKDEIKKSKYVFLSDFDYEFIERNLKEITNVLEIKSLILTFVGDLICIYLFKYVLKEYKRISEVNQKNITNSKI